MRNKGKCLPRQEGEEHELDGTWSRRIHNRPQPLGRAGEEEGPPEITAALGEMESDPKSIYFVR